MALLDIQRRGQQIGRIRIGELVDTGKVRNGEAVMRPTKLTAFRLTTGSQYAAQAVADLLGGKPRPWRNGQFEVYTERSELGVTVPPWDEVITQWYEKWSGGGCERRCDSQREQMSNGPCLCPHAEDPTDADAVAAAAIERARLAKMNPPRACGVKTRLNLSLPDLPGLGVWRIDTGSYYAALELGVSAGLMEKAREMGVFLPAVLRIDQREQVADGKTKRYPVPVLEPLITLRDLLTGAIASAGVVAQLPPAPGEGMRAIGSSASQQPTATPAPQQREPEQTTAAPQAGAAQMTAQEIADRAARATTRAEIAELGALAAEQQVAEDGVCTDPERELYEELHTYLSDRWKELPRVAEGNAAPGGWDDVQVAQPGVGAGR